MRVLTHPQHAGEPLPSKRPAKKAKSAKAGVMPQPMKVAGRSQVAASSGSAMATSGDSGAISVAERPEASRPKASTPEAPTSPVEVFAPDPEPQDIATTEPPSGSLLDGLDDTGLGVAGGDANDDEPTEENLSTEMPMVPVDKNTAPSSPEIGEVFELIEKLRDHVDAQNGRFEQAMGVLDQIKTSAAALPEIRERIDSMLASIDELKDRQFKGHEKVERALSAQSARLDTIAQAIERATQREERLATSLVEINQTILAVSTTNDRLASAIDGMRRHEAERDARIGRALTGAQRWLIVLTLVMGVGMVATIITAVLASG